MPESTKIAVVGCGYWGPNLIRNFRALQDCVLQAICDTEKKRLDHLAGLYPGVKTYTRFDQLMSSNDFDALVVATPVRFHYQLAKAALDVGKHVFIEKPMAASAAECGSLVETAKGKGRTLMVGHTFLYSQPVRRMKAIIDSGDIGEIQYISSRRLNLGLFQKDINVVWDLAPHDISIINYLMGESPCSVNCQGKAHVARGIEDVACMSLFFPSGGFATIQSSWLDPKKVREMTIVGTRKMIVYDDLEPLQKIKIYDQRVEAPPHYDTFAEFQYSYHYGDMYAPHLKQEEPLRVECQHFLDCIRTGQPAVSDGEAGLALVRVLECASESLRREGARVQIEA